MSANSSIEWTDATFNPWIGCQHACADDASGGDRTGGLLEINKQLHPGCENCYAEADFDNRKGLVIWGADGTRRKTTDAYWKQPFKWDRAAAIAGKPTLVFCASLADIFEDWPGRIKLAGKLHPNAEYWIRPDGSRAAMQPGFHVERWREGLRPLTMNDLRHDLFSTIEATPHLWWLLLTKRPQNVRPMLAAIGRKTLPDNCALGTSISDQPTADYLVPKLLDCGDLARLLFVSAEPLLGPIELNQSFDLWLRTWADGTYTAAWPRLRDHIHWVIGGGESGHKARPCNPSWARLLRDNTLADGVPFHWKQWGEWAPGYVNNRKKHVWCEYQSIDPETNACSCDDCPTVSLVGKKLAGRTLDGKVHDGRPAIFDCFPTANSPLATAHSSTFPLPDPEGVSRPRPHGRPGGLYP